MIKYDKIKYMQFKVPKFLEREPLIVGPLSFKQFLYFGAAALILFLLHYLVPFYLFLILLIILVGLAFSLAFVKIEGVPMPTVILQSFGFIFTSKMYLWQKKEGLKSVEVIAREKKGKKEQEIPLKISPKSGIRRLQSKIEGGY